MKDENILILCGFLDLFSVSIFINILSLHVKSFDVSTTAIGVFFSLYGALQMISGYLMGYLADKTSQKAILCLCALISSLGYFLLGFSSSFRSIFVIRFITGLFKQTQTLSRTILSTKPQLSNNEIHKLKTLGRFSTLSSVGFIFGPPLGGIIYEYYGFFYVTTLTSMGFLLMFSLFLMMKMEESDTKKFESKPNDSHKSGVGADKSVCNTITNRQQRTLNYDTKSDIRIMNNTDKDDSTWNLLQSTWDIQLSIFLLSFCPLLFRTNYSLALRELYQSTGTISGFATSYGAITGSIAGLAVPYIITYYHRYNSNMPMSSETRLLWHTSLILAISVIGCSLSPTFLLFITFQSPISFVNGLSREAFNVIITRRVKSNKVGRVMGMNASLVAFGRLIAPILGGLLQELSYRLPGLIGGMCAFIGALVIRFYFI